MKLSKITLYTNTVLFIIMILFGVNTFSARGHELFQKAWAAVAGITGEGTVNYIARFAGAANPSNSIGDSIIYDNGAGRIGIGTTAPAALLHLNGNGPKLYFSDNAGNPTGNYSIRNDDDSLRFRDDSSGADRLTIDTSGNFGIGTVAPVRALDVAIPSNGYAMRITLGGTNTIEMGSEGAFGHATMAFKGVDILMGKNSGRGIAFGSGVVNADVPIGATDINLKGNVGIGTIAPGNKLDVVGGDINMDGGRTIYSRGRMHIFGEEILYLLNRNGVVISKDWGGNGNLTVQNAMTLTPLPADPAGLTNGMMWMRQ